MNFFTYIEDEFRYLDDLGFRSEVENDHSVKYVNDAGQFVSVVYNAQEVYVSVRIGWVNQPKDALTMDEIMGIEKAPPLRHGFPDIDDMLHYLVSRNAYKLRNFGQRALAGDLTLMAEAKQRRLEATKRSTHRQGSD